MKIALLGECMIELSQTSDGHYSQGFGGDTLNTAVYMARLAQNHTIDYFTVVGDDAWSKLLLQAWQSEGVGVEQVITLKGRTPGLYIIQTNAQGERRFSYWRDTSPARDLFSLPQTKQVMERLSEYNMVYCSGITLSLYGEKGREKLFEAIDKARKHGAKFAFDANFRPRGWPILEEAKRAYEAAFERADILLASQEDLEHLYGVGAKDIFLAQTQIRERVLKQNDCACLLITSDFEGLIAPSQIITPIDTTAAGDSFAAAYLVARLNQHLPPQAVKAGHALAFKVVQHKGAIIPLEGM